jgi:nitrite reductase (NADH) large subunit
MAETLAKRFTGHETIFTGADESAELKLMGVEVVTLGRAIGQSASGIVLSHQNDQSYRKLIIEQGKVVGAACVGPWPELPQVRQAIHKQKFLWPIQRIRFRKTGSPWSPGGSLPVAQWPADAVICSCIGVTRAEISAAIGRGCQSLNSIALATKASTACGSCQSLVCELIGDRTTIITATGSRSMLVASACAAILCLAVLVSPAVPMATSVQSSWRSFDVLWRDEIARQVTGFTSLALIAVGLVFSLRKRSSWFQFGSYSFWRSVHGVLGATALVAVAVHTGLRMGQNLNFVLAVTFLAVAAVGSLVGITSGLETKLSGVPAMWVRRMRPRLTILHRWLFWPLPALIVLHIISFYWFSD